MTGPNWALDKDRNKLTVSFPSDPPVALELDAAAVDDLLRGVGMLRSMMLPEHSYDDPRGSYELKRSRSHPRSAVWDFELLGSET